MKSILIKISKAIKVLKRDGLRDGGERILKEFNTLFKRVVPGDVLIVTNGIGDSALYRAHHHAEELNLHGIRCSVAIQDNPFLTRYADKFNVFIFQRALFTPTVRRLVGNIKQQKKEIIFETDDLVYDPKYLKQMDYFKNMGGFEKKLYENGLGGEILRDGYVKICTTTTTFLANKLINEGKEVFLVPNKLSQEDVDWAGKIRNQKNGNDGKIVIGYFSGTISHNKDFAVVQSVLARILKKHKNVGLFVAGPIDLDNELAKSFGGRITSSSYVPRKSHFENISSVDINIAPLETGNPFCEAKSELKFFEAGIMEVPTVASATQTFSEAINDGVDGFVAKSESEWEEKLEKLILGQGFAKEMGRKALMKTIRNYTTKNSKNLDYYGYIKEKSK